MNNHKNFCVILAGGIGRRLWPCSRKHAPKQFLDFFGIGRTLLQQTYDRYAAFIPKENIVIATHEDYVDLVKQQLPDTTDLQIFTEPVSLSTAPAAACVCEMIRLLHGEANVIFTPADQHIINEQRFQEQITSALDYASHHNEFVAVGVRPATPNTGYGYIQMGESRGENLAEVQSFTEKPDLQFAEMFVNSGEFLWNTGLFISNVQAMSTMLHTAMPAVAEMFKSVEGTLTYNMARTIISQQYSQLPHQTLDLLLLEKVENIVVMTCDFGWADVGAWPELHEVEDKDADYNAVIGPTQVLFDNSFGNLVCLADVKAAVIAGLEGYLVAEKDGVLVICPNGDTATVRRLMNEAQMKLGDEFV